MGLFSNIQKSMQGEQLPPQQSEPAEAVQPPDNLPQEELPATAVPPVPLPETEAEIPPPAQIAEPIDDDEAMAASLTRIKDDIERLTRRNMKDCVAKHLAQLCAKEPALARAVLQPKKSMAKCFRYINRMATEYAKQEREDNDVTDSVYGCDVPDGLCYNWAVDYFNDPDAEEDREKPNPPVVNNVAKAKNTPVSAKKGQSPAACGDGQLSLTEVPV